MTTPTPMLMPLALRDTALTVTELRDAAQPALGFEAFRSKCLDQVARLREELAAQGQPADVIDDAAYAQCALLDEIALGRLDGLDRDAWEREPLQVLQFQTHDAGDALFSRIERRLAAPQPVTALLAVFDVVLGLGFQGRYALGDAAARAALVSAIDDHLVRAGWRIGDGPILVTHDLPRRQHALPPLAWAAIACVAAASIYVALNRWLTVSIARLAN